MSELINKLAAENGFEFLIVLACVAMMGICFFKRYSGDDRKIIDTLLWIGSAGIWICILFTL